ncbi:MAG: M20/M25/M40 family metallo-hydrolase, partial [Campylobacterota bacterium]|nr:M20/M25/M40 family metallo-hydrolase [Campylobacterota bacterium]
FSQTHGYVCKTDKVHNILCVKANSQSTLCLQSHYDIVCLEEGKIPQIIEQEGYLKAKDSTLGADNGMGCAMMMALMMEQKDCEFLFTSDEEIGLIGANDIEFKLQSTYMLNLDSEAQGEICIGCAGGIDIFATIKGKQTVPNSTNQDLYTLSIDNLDGGHSGVDIDKNIPNAIKLISKCVYESNAQLLDINGGERINSIPKSCTAIVACSTAPQSTHTNMKIEKIDTSCEHLSLLPKGVIEFIYSFSQGVRGYDKELGVVLNSINLAIIQTTIDGLKLSLSARSMDNEELHNLKIETLAFLKLCGFTTKTDGKYPAWKPVHNDFTAQVLDIYKRHIPEASLEAIHAGLECAIFKDKYPNMHITSIGPNIYFPHSCREEVEISSVIKVYAIVQDIVDSVRVH